ncbi:MAG: tetratricopeptide repeat protein, partial [Actinobacteria bacterium]|nr:tetratricopeptide repeat protein [Actinomycetota bacterium]
MEMGGVQFNGKLVEAVERCIREAQAPGIRIYLLVAALLSPEGVPKPLYSAIFQALERSVDIEAAQKVALTYSLVTIEDGELLVMHRLVQQLVLVIYPEYVNVLRKAEAQVCGLLETDSWSELNRQVYLSAECLKARIVQLQASPTDNEVSLCLHVAYFQQNVLGMGKYTQALVSQCEVWMQLTEDCSACNTLGLCFLDLGKNSLAGKWILRAVQLAEAKADTSQKMLASIYGNLSMIFLKQGNQIEGKKWLEKSTNARFKAGAESDLIYCSQAGLCSLQGDLEGAIDLYRKALAIREEKMGKDHPSVAVVYNNMALLYQKQGNLGLAKELLEKALSIDQVLLNPGHSSFVTNYLNLSGIYHAEGDLVTAKAWMLRCLGIAEDKLDQIHPDLALVYNNLSMIYDSEKNFTEAKKYCKKAIRIREQRQELELDLSFSYSNISLIYQAGNKLSKAEKYSLMCVQIRKKVLEPDHKDLATAYCNLSLIYKAGNNFVEAKRFCEEAVVIRAKCQELEADLATSYYHLYQLYRTEDTVENLIAAKDSCKKCIRIRKKRLGAEHKDLTYPFYGLSLLYKA